MFCRERDTVQMATVAVFAASMFLDSYDLTIAICDNYKTLFFKLKNLIMILFEFELLYDQING